MKRQNAIRTHCKKVLGIPRGIGQWQEPLVQQLARDIMSAMSVGELAEWDTTATLPDRMCAQAIRSQWETNRAKGKFTFRKPVVAPPSGAHSNALPVRKKHLTCRAREKMAHAYRDTINEQAKAMKKTKRWKKSTMPYIKRIATKQKWDAISAAEQDLFKSEAQKPSKRKRNDLLGRFEIPVVAPPTDSTSLADLSACPSSVTTPCKRKRIEEFRVLTPSPAKKMKQKDAAVVGNRLLSLAAQVGSETDARVSNGPVYLFKKIVGHCTEALPEKSVPRKLRITRKSGPDVVDLIRSGKFARKQSPRPPKLRDAEIRSALLEDH